MNRNISLKKKSLKFWRQHIVSNFQWNIRKLTAKSFDATIPCFFGWSKEKRTEFHRETECRGSSISVSMIREFWIDSAGLLLISKESTLWIHERLQNDEKIREKFVRFVVSSIRSSELKTTLISRTKLESPFSRKNERLWKSSIHFLWEVFWRRVVYSERIVFSSMILWFD